VFQLPVSDQYHSQLLWNARCWVPMIAMSYLSKCDHSDCESSSQEKSKCTCIYECSNVGILCSGQIVCCTKVHNGCSNTITGFFQVVGWKIFANSIFNLNILAEYIVLREFNRFMLWLLKGAAACIFTFLLNLGHTLQEYCHTSDLLMLSGIFYYLNW
jgi:hypothetical protein